MYSDQIPLNLTFEIALTKLYGKKSMEESRKGHSKALHFICSGWNLNI